MTVIKKYRNSSHVLPLLNELLLCTVLTLQYISDKTYSSHKHLKHYQKNILNLSIQKPIAVPSTNIT